MGNIFSNLAKSVTTTVNRSIADAGKVVSSVEQAVGHAVAPQNLVKAVGAIPGAILDSVVYPVGQLAGGAVHAAGVITRNADLMATGTAICKTDADLSKAALQDPLSAGEIVAGGALVIGGAITAGTLSAGGVALIAKGTAGLVSDTIKLQAQEQQKVTVVSAPPAPPPVAAVVAQAPVPAETLVQSAPPHPTPWRRFVLWFEFHFGHGKPVA